MRLKKPILMLVSLLFLSSAFGQQDPQFSQVIFNQNTINPGSAGSSDMITSSLINRIQWVGFTGAPKTTAFNVNAAISPFGFKSGVGLNIITDNPAFNKDLGLNLSYAARLKAGKGMLGHRRHGRRRAAAAHQPPLTYSETVSALATALITTANNTIVCMLVP